MSAVDQGTCEISHSVVTNLVVIETEASKVVAGRQIKKELAPRKWTDVTVTTQRQVLQSWRQNRRYTAAVKLAVELFYTVHEIVDKAAHDGDSWLLITCSEFISTIIIVSKIISASYFIINLLIYFIINLWFDLIYSFTGVTNVAFYAPLSGSIVWIHCTL